MNRYLMNLVMVLLLGACATQGGLEDGDDLSAATYSSEAPSLGEGGEMESLPGTMEEGEALGLNEDFETSPATAPEEATAPSTDEEAAPVTAEAPSMEEAAPMVAETEAAPMTPEPVLMEEPAPQALPSMEAESPKTEPVKKVARQAPAKPLRLPADRVMRVGEYLNRFYILRQGDTPEKVAELVYGLADKKSELEKWNMGSWKAGTVVFYLSSLQPNDGEMKSFYEERGIIPSEYEVKKGDTLGSIAVNTYGSKDSWREIGMVNNLGRGKLAPGTRLALYPADLSEYSQKLEATKAVKPVDQQINTLEDQISRLEADIQKELPSSVSHPETGKPVIEAGTIPSKLLTDDPKDMAAEGHERQRERSEKARQEAQANLASAEVKGFIQQNLLLIVTAIALMGAFALYYLVRRNRDEI